MIGLFRRESSGSAHFSSSESSPQKEKRGSLGPNAVLLFEEGTTADPLGVLQKSSAGGQQQDGGSKTPQTTPAQRRQARRGSMLELSGCVDEIDELEIDDDTTTSNTSTR